MGIHYHSSSGNAIYHNYLENNGTQVDFNKPFNVGQDTDSTNSWDNGYPSGGNYWSDYSGTDADNDGIGDTPYIVDVNNIDHYPLMNPWALPDIAVKDLSASKTIVAQGYIGTFNLTLENQGNKIEPFDTRVYANLTVIYSESIMLEMTNQTLSFMWNTTGFAFGNYTLSVELEPLEGEIDVADNTLTDGWVIVAMVGDITGPDGWPDGKCDIRDIGRVARNFGLTVPPAPANCDLTGPTTGVPDGKVDMRDISIVARHFGEHYP